MVTCTCSDARGSIDAPWESNAFETDRSGARSPCLLTSLESSHEHYSDPEPSCLQTFGSVEPCWSLDNNEAFENADGGSYFSWEGEFPEGISLTSGLSLGTVARAKLVSNFFKTRLCKNWVQTGSCQFEDRCNFAHGEEELRTPGDAIPTNSIFALSELSNSVSLKSDRGSEDEKLSAVYKTRMCKNYEKTATCKYGERCNFAHGEHELRRFASRPVRLTARGSGAAAAGV